MKKTTAKLLVAAMIGSSVVTALPSLYPTTVFAEQVVYTNLSKPVSIENLGTVELKTIFTVPSPEGQVVTFTFDVMNTSQQLIDFNRYWFRLQTRDTLRYPMRWVDQSKYLINPGERKTLFFYTVIPNTVKMSDLQLRFVKWDSSVASFERTIAEIPIHAEVIPTLGRSVSKFIGLTDQMIEARVQMDDVIENSQGIEVNYTLKMINKGKFAYSVPEYQYVLVTNDGVSYPLTANDAQPRQLLPMIEQEVELTGVLPNEVDLNKVALYVLHPYGDKNGQVMLPVTVFRVFEADVVETPQEVDTIRLGEISTLKVKGFEGKDSTLNLTVSSVQRYPWDHRDLLSAQIKIENTGEINVPIPKFDGKIKTSDFEIVSNVLLNDLDKDLLVPGESVTYQLIGYIPYNYEVKNAFISLSENSDSVKDKIIKSGIPEFRFYSYETNIEQLSPNKVIVLGEENKKNKIQLGDTTTFESKSGKYVVSRIMITNEEYRLIDLPNLIAYYKSENGYIYPATISEYSGKNIPKGSIVINVWTEIPNETKLEDFKLILGEKIEDIGIRNGVSYKLDVKQDDPQESIETINFYPYTLKFSDFYADMSSMFRFNVKTEKSKVNVRVLDRKLIMEIKDVSGEVLIEKEIIVEGSDAWNGEMRFKIPETSSGYLNYMFTMTIYEEFEDSKKVLAKQTFNVVNFLK